MDWNADLNKAVAFAIVLVLVPLCQKGHKKAHEESKKRMPEGWLKWLITHEFGKRTTKVSDGVRVVAKRPL